MAEYIPTNYMPSYLFKSERLGFRKWTPDDLAPFAAMNADPEVMRYFPAVLSQDETQGLMDRINKHQEEETFCFYAVDRLENEEFIGFIGLSRPKFEADFTPCVEIGWRLKASVWRRGYATEGALKCLEVAFDELGNEEIYSFTAHSNFPSYKVMEKIGMKKVGEFIHPKIGPDHPLNPHVLYKISKEEFEKIRK
ncbi:MAG: GNAT family N-acetyltransferase [Bacteroidota bacterium]